MKYNWKHHIREFWYGWGWPVIVAVIIATSFKSAIADLNKVPTGSMNPTIIEGDRIFVNKLAYDLKIPYTTQRLTSWQNPQRGDIVVFFSPADGQRMVKRVIGLPGDTVAMRNNRLFINGRQMDYEAFPQNGLRSQRLEENLRGKSHAIIVQPYQISLNSFDPIKIPENKYFVLGDNRDNSKDSRYFGCVERRNIVGRATAVVMSLKQDKFFQLRMSRFFSKLR